jgi:hypothetical protein
MQFHTQLGVSTVTHITSLIALTFIEILIATQKPSCKTSWKSPQFFIMILEKANYLI